MDKKLSASGGEEPPDPHQGAVPLDPAGGSAPRPPFIRVALRALAMVPPLLQKGWIHGAVSYCIIEW